MVEYVDEMKIGGKGDIYELEWKQEHTQPQLLLKHSVRTNAIRILKAFVHRMRWLFQIKDKSLVLGTHLVETYPNYT